MVNKIEQKNIFAKANIKIQKTKYIFSEEFSKALHEFSKEHYKEHLKVFRGSWTTWIDRIDIREKIQIEIEKMRANHFTETEEELMQKIYTSARFYYRKKEKRGKRKTQTQTQTQTQENKNQKKYIGFSRSFIRMMDNEINEQLMKSAELNAMIKINQKEAFKKFTMNHISEINMELGQLKRKYDTQEEEFIAREIAYKIKKAYQNRFYSICNLLNKI